MRNREHPQLHFPHEDHDRGEHDQQHDSKSNFEVRSPFQGFTVDDEKSPRGDRQGNKEHDHKDNQQEPDHSGGRVEQSVAPFNRTPGAGHA